MAERSRTLPGSTAEENYARVALPYGQQVLRVWRARDPAVLRTRLGNASHVVWAEDESHVLRQARADDVQLVGGVQPSLRPVEGATDCGKVSIRIRLA